MVISHVEAVQKIRDDLRYVLDKFPLESLEHLNRSENRERLVRGAYYTPEGEGCMFYLLSEVLPEPDHILNLEDLTFHFTGGSGVLFRERPEYQSARNLVRLFDGSNLTDPGRYGDIDLLEFDLLFEVLEEEIEFRRRQQSGPDRPHATRIQPRRGSRRRVRAAACAGV